jgi:hypothetical protein
MLTHSFYSTFLLTIDLIKVSIEAFMGVSKGQNINQTKELIMTKPTKTKVTQKPASNVVQREATPCDTEKRETKQSLIIGQLSREEGTTIAQLMEVTGWKSHSVRGHLSNLRKKRGLKIETFTTEEGKNGYRILQEKEANQEVEAA